ncbi:MAG: D-tyrosyl-tRNA(Tyr) deacylase [Clostridia bacterium]|nr:D-tyrosyl-tRNA(Tyr) deacylase [Clostridia bacterium]
MKIVLQRVKKATVYINGDIKGAIKKGYLILLGIGKNDTEEIACKLIEKIKKLRIFEDENGKTNLSLEQCGGKVMVVSQFTLYANCKKGNRPSFIDAAEPDLAERLYNYFLKVCKEQFGDVQHGEFGADMNIELVNDGPFTLILENNQE